MINIYLHFYFYLLYIMDIIHLTHICTHAYTYIRHESMRRRKTFKEGKGKRR